MGDETEGFTEPDNSPVIDVGYMSLPADVQEALEEAGVAPRWICTRAQLITALVNVRADDRSPSAEMADEILAQLEPASSAPASGSQEYRDAVRYDERRKVLADLDACLPAGADRPVTPELLTALLALYDVAANEIAVLESDRPDYSLIAADDVMTLDDASEAVEDLLFPATTDEQEAEREAAGEQS